jgi:hypothetical protein
MDTKLLELESGMTQNESVTYAVRSAIEAAVLSLIEQGDERGYWKIVYPENWVQEVAKQEQAYWMRLNEEKLLPDVDKVKQNLQTDPDSVPLWKKILLKGKTNIGEKE